MTDSPFRPFDDNLDKDAALAHLARATDGADDGELFLERTRSEALVFDDGRVRTARTSPRRHSGARWIQRASPWATVVA